jgi:hypothetical protein
MKKLYKIIQKRSDPVSACPVAGVLDEPYSPLTPLSEVDVQAASLHRLEPCPSYVARHGHSGERAMLSKVCLKLPPLDTDPDPGPAKRCSSVPVRIRSFRTGVKCVRLFLFAGDSQLSDAVPPAAWHRRVGQLVIVIIDALRADFVLDHPSKVGTCI